MFPCPCQSEKDYADCCQPYHQHIKQPETAEKLMRSRYSAYALQQIDYIIETTVPSQQKQLDKNNIAEWSHNAKWLGLQIHSHTPSIKPHHAQVDFTAHFAEKEHTHAHREHSAFVYIQNKWYFIDPTVALPSMKAACICGSQRKFKACCGQFFR